MEQPRDSLERSWTPRAGTWSLASAALAVSLGTSLLCLARPLVDSLGASGAAAYAAAALAFAPVVAFHGARVWANPHAAEQDVQGAARALHHTMLAVVVGGVALLGHLSVLGLLLGNLTVRLDIAVERVVGYAVDDRLLLAGLVASLLVSALSRTEDGWTSRSTLLILSFIAYASPLLFELATRSASVLELPTEQRYDRWLTDVGLLAAGLWGTDVAMSRVGRARRPIEAAFVATLLPWVAVGVFGVCLVPLLIRAPELFMRDFEAPLRWQTEPGVLIALFASLSLLWLAADWSLTAARRLIAPPRSKGLEAAPPSGGWREATLLALAAGTGAWLVPRVRMAELAAGTFLLTTLSLALAVVITEKGRRQWAHLHPLLRLGSPVFAAAVCGYFLLLLPARTLLLLAAAGAVGAAWRAFRRSEHALEAGAVVQVPGPVASPIAEPEVDAAHSVLVVCTPDSNVEDLLAVAHGVATASERPAVVFGVVEVGEDTGASRGHLALQMLRSRLRAALQHSWPDRSEPRLWFTTAVSPAKAIVEAAERWNVEQILLDYGPPGSEDDLDSLVPEVFMNTGRSLVVLRGGPWVHASRAVVLHHDTTFDSLACAVADTFLTDEGAVLEWARPQRRGKVGSPDLPLTRSGLKEVTLPPGAPCEGAATLAGDSPLLLSFETDPVLNRAVYGGAPLICAQRRQGPTLLIKPAETAPGFWLRRVWWSLTYRFGATSLEHRAAVLREMRAAARGDIDFYVLMMIASVIATTGLLLDSTAVVIGAMLIAPLMRPIVAGAHGFVVGSAALVSRSAGTVLRGAFLAVAVATTFTLLLPMQPASDEVLARVRPNLLDLVVALSAGAAAAYGQARKNVAGALSGVAIAVALVPPLCVVGFGLGAGQVAIAGGALLLFLTNLVAIVLVAGAVFFALGYRPARASHATLIRWGARGAVLAVVALVVPLTVASWRSLEQRIVTWRLQEAVAQIEGDTRLDLQDLRLTRSMGVLRADVTLFAFEALTESERKDILSTLNKAARVPLEVRTTWIEARRVTSTPGESTSR